MKLETTFKENLILRLKEIEEKLNDKNTVNDKQKVLDYMTEIMTIFYKIYKMEKDKNEQDLFGNLNDKELEEMFRNSFSKIIYKQQLNYLLTE